MKLRVVDLHLELLSEKAFAPFGEVVGAREGPPMFSGPHINAWGMNFACDGGVEIMFARYIRQPMEFSLLESHRSVTQGFIPLGYYPSVMVVGAADARQENPDPPSPESVRAFLIPGDNGILLWRHTWHAVTRFPVLPSGAEFALITSVDTQRELERERRDGTLPKLTRVVDYADKMGVTYRVVDAQDLLSGAMARGAAS